MRSTQIIFAFATIFLTQSVMAQGQGQGHGPPPGDVNVINTPDVNVANVPDVFVVNDGNSPLPVTIQNGVQTLVEWRYVGLTTDEDDGRFEFGGLVGVAAMNKMCAVEYGAGARAASIAEAYFRDDGISDSRAGWLAPGQPLIVLDAGDGAFLPVDAMTGQLVGQGFSSSLTAITGAYCARYRIALVGNRGPVTRPTGEIVPISCGNTRPAACSAPVAIPVAP